MTVMTIESLRVPGALALAVLGFQGGRLVEAPYHRRLESLRGWMRTLERVESEIRHGRRDLADALERATADAPGEVDRALGRFLASIGEARPTAELWKRAVLEDRALLERDRAVLAALGPVLGRYPPDEQGRHLEAARRELERLMADAEAELSGRGRALKVLIGLGGAALAVLVA